MITKDSDLGRQQVKQSINYELNDRDTFGDNLKKKKEKDIVRVVFQNINGLGISEEADKRSNIKEFINKYKIDIMGIEEVNTNWKIVGKKDTLQTLACKWFRNSRVITSNNAIVDSKSKHQYGGVATITSGDIALKVGEIKHDTPEPLQTQTQ